MRRIHVVGAGMAGLAAATASALAGAEVTIYEAAQQAGGRCRSYFDAELDCRIDNGNHLLVSGNEAAMAYIAAIGSAGTFSASDHAAFPFVDLKSAERWSVRPNDGRIPWWILATGRNVPGIPISDYLDILALYKAGEDASVAATLNANSHLYERLWKPICVAALNTEPESASASLLRSVLMETFGRGSAAMRPILPKIGLSESLVEPALSLLRSRNAVIRFGARLRSITFDATNAISLSFGEEAVDVSADDRIILALPSAVVLDLIHGIDAPDEFRAIVNAHYRFGTDRLRIYHDPGFVGLIGGDVDWVFIKPGVLSTTTSAASRLVDVAAEELGPRLWREVAMALELGDVPMPQYRVVKEKRATFAATPKQCRRRPSSATRWPNLYLAGDWTNTGWPATIEGAVRSGFIATEQALKGRG